jgi:hypothetical protein
MVSAKVILGVASAVVVALVIVIIVYSNKTPFKPECQGNIACPDTWVDEKGVPIKNVTRYCNPDGTIRQPNVGPGKCANPCTTGEVACWDSKAAIGRCIAGTNCPTCFSDTDCGGDEKPPHGSCMNAGDPAKSYCRCNLPWNGATCQSSGCKSAADCGKNGTCVQGVCACKQGWATPPNGDPCSVCADDLAGGNAWGPPGSCIFRRYTTTQDRNGLKGAVLPLATNSSSCSWVADSQPVADLMCKAEFGSGASSPLDGSPAAGNYFCDGSGGTYNACTYCGGLGDGHQPLCWVPGGYYSSAPNPPGPYQPCDVQAKTPTTCGAPKPPGYVGPYIPPS